MSQYVGARNIRRPISCVRSIVVAKIALVLTRQSREDRGVRVPLIERLDPTEPSLAAYDASAAEVDTRRAFRRRRKPATGEVLDRRMRRYFEWCDERLADGKPRHQKDPQFVKPETPVEYTLWMTRVKRYHPTTVYAGLQALEEYAEAAGVFVSFGPARTLVGMYRKGIKPQVG